MNCSKIKERLSEYIDESLEAETKALVEDHLSTCQTCQQEVASLRMLINDLSSMESVAPPTDFLDQLHERMEQRNGFSKILRIWNFFLHVKLPMKFAGAAIMAVLVFAVFQVQQDDYGTKTTPLSREEKVAEEGDRGYLKSVPKEEVYNNQLAQRAVKAEPFPEMTEAPGDYEKDVPITLGGIARDEDYESPLLQKTEKPKAKPPVMREEKSKTEMDIAERPLDNNPKKGADKRIGTELLSRRRTPIELVLVTKKMQRSESDEERTDVQAAFTQETKMRRTLTMGEPLPPTQPERDKKLDGLLLQLREVIERSGGEILSVQYEEGTKRPESLSIEIPARQFDIFHNNLKDLGELQTAPISLIGQEQEILPIQIRLLAPR